MWYTESRASCVLGKGFTLGYTWRPHPHTSSHSPDTQTIDQPDKGIHAPIFLVSWSHTDTRIISEAFIVPDEIWLH